MADETLIDQEIKSLGDELIEPFAPECIKGASYDIRVGEIAILPPPQGESQLRAIALGVPDAQMSIPIPPGSTCILRSLEKIHMPQDMKGRLSLRAFHAKRLIFYPGGIVDPGYNDFLFLPIANLGDAPVELKYGEALVTAEFIKLDKKAGAYEPGQEPPSKAAVPSVLFDRVKLSGQVQQNSDSIQNIFKKLETNETLINASQRILDLVVLAAVAAGAVTAIVLLFPTLSFPWNAVAIGLGALLGAGATTLLIWGRLRQSSGRR